MTATPAPELSDVKAITASEGPRFHRRLLRSPAAIACLVYLTVVVLVAILAPVFLAGVADQLAGDLRHAREFPSSEHPLGTDSLGRDVLQRLLVGTRITMLGVAQALTVALGLAIPLGLMAGYFGGWFDRVVGWITDLTFAMPGIAIVLVVLAVFPQSMLAAMVTVGVLFAPGLARIIRSATLPIKKELYIDAARVSGLSRRYIIVRHVFPRVSGPVIVLASTYAGYALLVQSGLAYLGLVVPVPEPSWGGMIGEGIENLVLQPWLIWPPGVVTVATIVAFGILGDLVRDASAEAWTATRPMRVRRRDRKSSPAARTSTLRRPVPQHALLRIDGLTVTLQTGGKRMHLIEGVSFEVGRAETVGLVGESGCGKTITAMSILGMLPGQATIAAGQILFEGKDLAALAESEMRPIRGREIGLISQEPMLSLNPAFRIGWQLALAVRTHHDLSRREAQRRAIELLKLVQLPEPDVVAKRYPHELSGGMAQRVAIARALAGEPKLLLADEPTTALDVTVQAEILDLLKDIQRERNMAILLVSHDWGVIADLCSRGIVMYAGQIVEQAPLTPMFRRPLHPYTEALLTSDPHSATAAGAVLPAIPGSVPSPGNWPLGCHFNPRCKYATDDCRVRDIPVEEPQPDRSTRCIRYEELAQA